MEDSFICSGTAESMRKFFPSRTPARNEFRGVCFLLTTQGEAVIEIDNRPYQLRSGGLLTLLPGHLLQKISNNDTFNCQTLAYTFDSMNDFPYMLQSHISEKMEQIPYISLLPEEHDLLKKYYGTITTHALRTTHGSYREILCSLVFIFTAEVCGIYSGKQIKTTATHEEKITDDFFRLLHQNIRTNRHITFYAGQLFITPKHLAKIIRHVTGQAPSYWITDFTIREMKSLLCSTPLTVTQLADQLNFPDSSVFARYFRRNTGISPQQFRTTQKN